MTSKNTFPAVQVESLTVRYGFETILRSIQLTIPQGTVVGLIGRNGAGKSSLLRCLVGLTTPDHGHCSLLGSPSLDLDDGVRERLGYVSQTPDLLSWLDGNGHFRRIGSLYPHWNDSRASELSIDLDLPLGVRAGHMSVGDQQKLSVVLALGHDPDLLILDEPVSSLDPLARRDFMRVLFQRLPDRHSPRTVVISSHLLTDLERVVTHLAFMRNGAIQMFGEWDEISENVRALALPVGSPVLSSGAGILHRRVIGATVHVVYDARVTQIPLASGYPLNLDDLFEELNT